MWLIGFVVIITLLTILTWHIQRNSPIAQVQRELERLRKAGEPLSYHDLIPPVPKHLDATPLYRKAIAQLDADKQTLPQSHWIECDEFVFPSSPPKPVNLANVQQVLHVTQPALQTLRQAVELPHMRLTNWDVEHPVNVLFPQFSPLSRICQVTGC